MKNKQFWQMPLEEIEKFEESTNSIVLFDNKRGIAFQCTDSNLALIIDGIKQPFVAIEEQIESLKTFINKNF